MTIMISSLKHIIEGFSSLNVLCIGDIMLDRFVRGTVDRISPEAPVPVLNFSEESLMLGGAGNVAANLLALKIKTTLVGRIGQDPEGEQIKILLDKSLCNHSVYTSQCPTITKTRFIMGTNHIMRFDKEIVEPLSEEQADMIMDATLPHICDCDVVLLSDYGKGLLTEYFTQKIISACAKLGKRVLVDPKGLQFEKYRGSYLVKPNRKELELVCGTRFDTKDPLFIQRITSATREVGASIGVDHIIVTLGEKGMLYVPSKSNTADLSPILIPTYAKEVFDVSGAGDTSFALLGASIAAGAELSEAMQLANVASGIVVGKLGTATVKQEELIKCLYDQSSKKFPSLSKIVTLADALSQTASLRATGHKIGFTNGCFDLLHMGHLHSLWQAKELCDFLIVALNSDSSVKRLKGELRPIQDEETRTSLLASLECVDMVILFDDLTALPLVKQLRPDLIVKEGYLLEDWPEAQFVKNYGGQAITLKRVEGFSTTALIDKLRTESCKNK
jgi:D-beta-D-heptose 7-phosphate kinase/D-beta-D-heptose 1-phosphate adenosyltransferase